MLGAAEGAGSLMETEEFYTLKLAYGPEIAAQSDISLEEPLEQIVRKAAQALGKPVDRLFVCILDRPRHREMIDELRRLRVRIKLIQDCDVSGALATCRAESGVDLMYGVGGSPEAVIAGCGIKCLGGRIQAQAPPTTAAPSPAPPSWTPTTWCGAICVFAATRDHQWLALARRAVHQPGRGHQLGLPPQPLRLGALADHRARQHVAQAGAGRTDGRAALNQGGA